MVSPFATLASIQPFRCSQSHHQLHLSIITMQILTRLLLLAFSASVLATSSQCNKGDPCLSALTGPLKTIAIAFCRSCLGGGTIKSTTTVTKTGPGQVVTTTNPAVTQIQTDDVIVTSTTIDVDTVAQPNPTTTLVVTTITGFSTIILKARATAGRSTQSTPNL